MLSDHQAPDLHFAGLGAEGSTAAEAAELLALALRHWAVDHDGCRIVQLTILPAAAAPVGAAASPAAAFGASAMIIYIDGALGTADVAEAVAAAVEEIQQAQVVRPEDDPPRFV
jgi:hypothetical protein